MFGWHTCWWGLWRIPQTEMTVMLGICCKNQFKWNQCVLGGRGIIKEAIMDIDLTVCVLMFK